MQRIEIKNKIRLIELFAGVGSQAMALRNIGADFERYLTCEWWVNAVASYKAIHAETDTTDYSAGKTREEITAALFDLGISADGKNQMKYEQIKKKPEKWQRETYNNIKATKNLVNIAKISGSDLNITETEKYTYIMTYSFPCQDLSIAGKMAGMDRGTGTRSGMLWEVERLLNETAELPQVLLMENVPQVIGKRNEHNFAEWCAFLKTKGYQNYTQILNAKDYGVPQNRARAFMVSIKGDLDYIFPEKIDLQKTIKDYLEPTVDERYYIPKEKTAQLIEELTKSGKAGSQVE